MKMEHVLGRPAQKDEKRTIIEYLGIPVSFNLQHFRIIITT